MYNGEGENDDGEGNDFFAPNPTYLYYKNPGSEVTPPTRCTVQRLQPLKYRISSDIGFASFS